MKNPKDIEKINEFIEVLEQVPDEKRNNVIDFIIHYTRSQTGRASKSERKKLDLSWAGSLSHLNMTGLELQEEGKKFWEQVD